VKVKSSVDEEDFVVDTQLVKKMHEYGSCFLHARKENSFSPEFFDSVGNPLQGGFVLQELIGFFDTECQHAAAFFSALADLQHLSSGGRQGRCRFK
jgi:hypothetical protein